MKFFATIAAATLAFAATASAQIASAEEPEVYEADATVSFVGMPESLEGNATDAYAITETTEDSQTDGRQLQAVAITVAALQVAAAAAPIIADIIKGRRKECQQLACWISSERTCAIAVAERVQRDITMGRDRYRYESIQNNGMWVRYWRTKFEPVDRGVIASGKCSNGKRFEVTNCQSTGRVHC